MSRNQFTLLDNILPESFENEMEKEQWKIKAVNILKTIICEKLSRRQKQIIVLYYYKGLSQREISRRLGISESAVSRRKSAALKKLRYFMDILRS